MVPLKVTTGLAALMLTTLLCWRVWRVIYPAASKCDRPALFFLVVFTAILVLRLPNIRFYQEINPDESQMVAQGARFVSHPVPWRDVDGTTSGPLNSMFLSLPMYFGASATWATARTMLWAANCLTLLFLYLALRSFGTPAEAQVALIPTLLFYAFTSDRDSTIYTSETLPVLLLAGCLFLLAREWVADSSSGPRLFCLGLLAGAVPFAKLQAVPLALFLMGVGLVRFAVRNREAGPLGPAGWRKAALLCLGAVLVPGLILGVVFARGAFGDFWKSYILASGAYMQLPPGESRLRNAVLLFKARSDIQAFSRCAAAVLALFLTLYWLGQGRLERRLRWALAVVLADILLTAGCIFAPGKPTGFSHYLILFVPVLAVFLGLLFFAGKAMLDHQGVAGPENSLAGRRWVLLFTLLAVGFSIGKVSLYFRSLPPPGKLDPFANMSYVSKSILAVSQPGDTMSIWGWRPDYYVETGLIPATRDAIGHYIITPGPYQDYFRNRYLKDLEQSRPAIFIDAVVEGAFTWNWSEADKHESFPELAGFINENYALWQNILLTEKGRPLRLYVRKERFAKLNLSPAAPVNDLKLSR